MNDVGNGKTRQGSLARGRILRGAIAAVVAGGSLGASVGRAGYTTVVNNGPSGNRVDIVFLGDGYTSADLASKYGTHIGAMVNHFFNEGQDPYPRYQKFFNVHRIDLVSNQSGADVPPLGVFRDTALDASYYWDGTTDRLLYVNTSKAEAALSSNLAGAGFSAEMKLVTVNDTRYGGGGGSWAVYAGGNSQAPEIALHELGHSFSGLADEYGGNTGTYAGGEPFQPDVTKDPTGAKWARWLGYVQPGIGTIGAYEGGLYYDHGIYRPSLNSKMRVLGAPFDAVGREKIILDIYNYVRPLDAYTANTSTRQDRPVSTTPVDTNVIKMNWSVNGQLVAGATGTMFDPTDYGYGVGTYTVTARAFDDTPWVRTSLDKLEQSVSWTYTVRPHWNIDGGGDWASSGNWTGGVPNAPGAEARFTYKLATPSKAAASIAVVGTRTVGRLEFDNAVSNAGDPSGTSYVLSAGAGGQVVMAASSGNAGIAVLSGRHELSVPLRAQSSTDVDVAVGGRLTLRGPSLNVDPGATLAFRSGLAVFAPGAGGIDLSGNLRIDSSAQALLNAGQVRLAGATVTNRGALTMGGAIVGAGGTNLLRNEGVVTTLAGLAPAVGVPLSNAGTVVVVNGSSLAIDGTFDNTGVVRLMGGTVTFGAAVSVTDLVAEIREAYRGGRWNGLTGITSPLAAAELHGATGVGYAPAGGGGTRMMYTWYGDANVDGAVDDRDLAMMMLTGTTWSTGDFNYDGRVDADDYALLGLGASYGTSNIGAFVPEPGGAGVALFAAGVLVRWRGGGRRRGWSDQVGRHVGT